MRLRSACLLGRPKPEQRPPELGDAAENDGDGSAEAAATPKIVACENVIGLAVCVQRKSRASKSRNAKENGGSRIPMCPIVGQIARGGTMRRPQKLISARIEEARQLDKELRLKMGTLKKLTLEVGGILKRMREEELHKYIRKPGSRKGYVDFADYASDATGMSGSSVWMLMKIFGMTQGTKPVSPLDIEKMPIVNAYELSRVPTERRTFELIEEAKKNSTNKFKVKIQEIENEFRSPEEQKPVRVDFYRKLHPQTAEMLENTIHDFCLLPAVRDGDLRKTLSEKAIESVCSSALSFAGDEIAAERDRLQREAIEITEPKADPTEGPEVAAPTSRVRIVRRAS
jgi:hypothetical protein